MIMPVKLSHKEAVEFKLKEQHFLAELLRDFTESPLRQCSIYKFVA